MQQAFPHFGEIVGVYTDPECIWCLDCESGTIETFESLGEHIDPPNPDRLIFKQDLESSPHPIYCTYCGTNLLDPNDYVRPEYLGLQDLQFRQRPIKLT
jgi:hypothetical protein